MRERDVERMVEAAKLVASVSLVDALAMVVVLAETGDVRFERWAARWVQRVKRERHLQTAAVESVERLMRILPRQSEARAVEVALASYAAPPRTWS